MIQSPKLDLRRRRRVGLDGTELTRKYSQHRSRGRVQSSPGLTVLDFFFSITKSNSSKQTGGGAEGRGRREEGGLCSGSERRKRKKKEKKKEKKKLTEYA